MFKPTLTTHSLLRNLQTLTATQTRRQFATAAAAVHEITSNEAASDPTKPNWIDLKNPAIKSGVKAFVLEVPKKLPENDFVARRRAVHEHSHYTTDLWRKISFYVAIPAVIVTAIFVYKAEMAHAEHHKHVVEQNGGVEPERKVYSYMNIRNKPFPWGNQSLFFNPKVNIPADEP